MTVKILILVENVNTEEVRDMNVVFSGKLVNTKPKIVMRTDVQYQLLQ